MQIIYLPEAEKDLDYWIKTGNKATFKKIGQKHSLFNQTNIFFINK